MINPNITNHRFINGVTQGGKYLNTCVHCEKEFYTTFKDEDYCQSKICRIAKKEVTGDNSLDFKFEENG